MEGCLKSSGWPLQPKGLKLLAEWSQNPVSPLTAVGGPSSNPLPRLVDCIRRPSVDARLPFGAATTLCRTQVICNLPIMEPKEIGSSFMVRFNPCCHWPETCSPFFPSMILILSAKLRNYNRGHIFSGSLLNLTSWPFQPRGYTLQGGPGSYFSP